MLCFVTQELLLQDSHLAGTTQLASPPGMCPEPHRANIQGTPCCLLADGTQTCFSSLVNSQCPGGRWSLDFKTPPPTPSKYLGRHFSVGNERKRLACREDPTRILRDTGDLHTRDQGSIFLLSADQLGLVLSTIISKLFLSPHLCCFFSILCLQICSPPFSKLTWAPGGHWPLWPSVGSLPSGSHWVWPTGG